MATPEPDPVATQETVKSRAALRRAWLSLALLPVSVIAAMVLGDWLVAEMGVEDGAADVDPGVALRAGVPALLVLISPTLLTVWFGLRARRYRHPAWKGPVTTAVAIAVGFAALNLLQPVAAFLGL